MAYLIGLQAVVEQVDNKDAGGNEEAGFTSVELHPGGGRRLVGDLHRCFGVCTAALSDCLLSACLIWHLLTIVCTAQKWLSISHAAPHLGTTGGHRQDLEGGN